MTSSGESASRVSSMTSGMSTKAAAMLWRNITVLSQVSISELFAVSSGQPHTAATMRRTVVFPRDVDPEKSRTKLGASRIFSSVGTSET